MIDYPSKLGLSGRTAVVTGGLGLLGREIVAALAQAGAKTIAVDINRAEGREFIASFSGSADVSYENFDLSRPEKTDKFLEKLASKHGYLDVLVNNAYPRTPDWGTPIEELKLSSWRKNIDMQLNSYSWISRKACLLMRPRGGSVVNLGSIYGVVGNDFTVYEGTGLTSPMAYAAIKGGVVNLTRYLASYFGKYGVRVNAVCPGGVLNHQDRRFIKNYSSKTPLKRMARPEEVAAAVLFTASDMASYVTGAALMVDGGWSAV